MNIACNCVNCISAVANFCHGKRIKDIVTVLDVFIVVNKTLCAKLPLAGLKLMCCM